MTLMSGCSVVMCKPTDTQGINQPKAVQGTCKRKDLRRLVSITYRQGYQSCFSELVHGGLQRDLQHPRKLLKRTVPRKEDHEPDDDG
jgi:hypothetical protein